MICTVKEKAYYTLYLGLDTESAPYVHKLEFIEVEREEAFHYRLLQTERLK
jgi:hypothetical protein